MNHAALLWANSAGLYCVIQSDFLFIWQYVARISMNLKYIVEENFTSYLNYAMSKISSTLLYYYYPI